LTASTVGTSIRDAGTRLADIAESGPHEARLLLGKILARSKEWLVSHPETLIADAAVEAFDSLVDRRADGYPLPYLLGEWEFYGRMFAVDEAVLIPRPETELLIEHALDWAQLRNLANPLRILDVGTGSGCIAATLGAELPGSTVLATDVSRAALEIARANLERHRLANVQLSRSDLLASVRPPAGGFDLVCANLPYIPTAELARLPVAEFEPRLALDGGPDGLALIRRLLADLPDAVAAGGLILLEIEESQGSAVTRLARAGFPSAGVELIRDLSDNDRLVAVQTP
jgi:release factor glutamine methyltransferase